MTLYRSDWKPSELEPGRYWFQFPSGYTVVGFAMDAGLGIDPIIKLEHDQSMTEGMKLGPRIEPPSENPVSGACCSCGNDEDEESECPNREDGTHCVHWWDGPEIEYRCSNCGEPCNESGCSRLPSCAGQTPRRIDDPADDATPTQEIRIPVAYVAEILWKRLSAAIEAAHDDDDFDSEAVAIIEEELTRIPIPAPQPDIEVKGEVEA